MDAWTCKMASMCAVCNEEASKYKCSACFSPYCSLNCWKQHKSDDSCQVKEKTQENDLGTNCIDKKKYFTEDTVSEEKLTLLGESKLLKEMLRNKYLQGTLKAIYDSSNPEDSIKAAMKDPEFVGFVDECLKVVEDSND